MKRLLPWVMPAVALLAAGGYLFLPPFALAVNQLCEMLGTGNTRGLMMVYHSAGEHSLAAAGAVTALALLVPVFKSHYLVSANTGYFGQWAGLWVTWTGGLLSVGVLLLLGATIAALLPLRLRTALGRLKHRWPMALCGAAALILYRLL